MNIRVVATAVNGSFIATGNGSFYVLTIDDTRPIEIGNVLSGIFDGHGSLFYSVRNVSSGDDVRICLEDWECSVDVAIRRLLGFMRSRPGVILAGSKRFISNTNNIADEIRAEILKS